MLSDGCYCWVSKCQRMKACTMRECTYFGANTNCVENFHNAKVQKRMIIGYLIIDCGEFWMGWCCDESGDACT